MHPGMRRIAPFGNGYETPGDTRAWANSRYFPPLLWHNGLAVPQDNGYGLDRTCHYETDSEKESQPGEKYHQDVTVTMGGHRSIVMLLRLKSKWVQYDPRCGIPGKRVSEKRRCQRTYRAIAGYFTLRTDLIR